MRLYRGEAVETEAGSQELMKEKFPKGKYADVLGLCKVATLAEIEAQGWSLNPGRYVGVAERAADDFEFAVRLEELNEELETLNVEARELEERIAENVAALSGVGFMSMTLALKQLAISDVTRSHFGRALWATICAETMLPMGRAIPATVMQKIVDFIRDDATSSSSRRRYDDGCNGIALKAMVTSCTTGAPSGSRCVFDGFEMPACPKPC